MDLPIYAIYSICFSEETLALKWRIISSVDTDVITTPFFSYIFLGVVVYMYLCRPSEASTRFCVIPGGYPPQD
jgi:hypothetical protein